MLGVADVQPRPVTVPDATSPEYRPSATEVLASLGVQDPNPQVRRAVRADLDGGGPQRRDGRMDVVIASRYYEGASAVAYELRGDRLAGVLESGCGV